MALTPPKRFVKAGNLGFPQQETLESTTLHDGTFVKKVVQTVLVDHKTKGRRVESLTIDEFKKSKKADPWPSFASSRITLDHESIRKLVTYLLAQKDFLEFQRSTTYTLLTGASSLSDLSEPELDALVKLVQLAAQQGKLSDMVKPELVENISAALQQARYKKSIDELKAMITNKELSEDDYRQWFLSNHWVFGTEYSGPEDGVKIGWAVKGDIVLRSVDGYQDIIELKLPDADPLNEDTSHKNFYPSVALSKAIAQVVKYFQETEDARTLLAEKEKLPFLKPRARIVIGRSRGWSQEKLDALRRLNASLHNIQIMTYDHLYASAVRIVQYYEKTSSDL